MELNNNMYCGGANIKGLVTKKIADFFYVEAEGRLYEAKPRGSFKKAKQDILVGDKVDITILDDMNSKAVIENIHERINMLIRPNVANITKLILVFSVKNPKLNVSLVDNFLIMAKKNKIDVVLCFSKIDLDEDNSYEEIASMYEDIGYDVVRFSSKNKQGLSQIKSKIKDDITVIAGPSGAGKSSLINELSTEFNQQTSMISMKLQKGKNTTTYATLLKLSDNSYVADTPGFTSLKLIDVEVDELKYYFIEFDNTHCKYANKCLHDKEPDCNVIREVELGIIKKSRYDSYIRMLNDIRKANKRRRY